jgi:hypothetical protein
MEARGLNSAQITKCREHVESYLAVQLEQAGSAATLDDIKEFILYTHHSDGFRGYVLKMLELLCSSNNDIDSQVSIIEDAWNYFPHQSLNGKCPAEVFSSKLE